MSNVWWVKRTKYDRTWLLERPDAPQVFLLCYSQPHHVTLFPCVGQMLGFLSVPLMFMLLSWYDYFWCLWYCLMCSILDSNYIWPCFLYPWKGISQIGLCQSHKGASLCNCLLCMSAYSSSFSSGSFPSYSLDPLILSALKCWGFPRFCCWTSFLLHTFPRPGDGEQVSSQGAWSCAWYEQEESGLWARSAVEAGVGSGSPVPSVYRSSLGTQICVSYMSIILGLCSG